MRIVDQHLVWILLLLLLILLQSDSSNVIHSIRTHSDEVETVRTSQPIYDPHIPSAKWKKHQSRSRHDIHSSPQVLRGLQFHSLLHAACQRIRRVISAGHHLRTVVRIAVLLGGGPNWLDPHRGYGGQSSARGCVRWRSGSEVRT